MRFVIGQKKYPIKPEMPRLVPGGHKTADPRVALLACYFSEHFNERVEYYL